MCAHPLYKSLTTSHYNQFTTLEEFNAGRAIQINCGKCHDCITHKLQKRLTMWLLHIDHYKKNNLPFYCYFITFTYDDSNLWLTQAAPYRYQLQKLLKRWRKNFKLKELKYCITTELGTKTGRIHHHAFIFSERDFLPKQPNGKSINGLYYYQNEAITWPFGFHSINQIDTSNLSQLTKTIKYTLKYVYKSPLGLMSSKKIGYERIKEIERDDGTFIYNGYVYKSPWKENNLTNTEKMQKSLLFSKHKANRKVLPLLDLTTKEPTVYDD